MCGAGGRPDRCERCSRHGPSADLPSLGLAPEFTGTQQWFNTEGRPISIPDEVEQGHVVLIDFWTYTCINCIRTLPYLKAWDEEYRDDGLTIVGVHSPEFPFEKDAANVEDAIADNGIGYPVVQDNELRPGPRGATSTGPRST